MTEIEQIICKVGGVIEIDGDTHFHTTVPRLAKAIEQYVNQKLHEQYERYDQITDRQRELNDKAVIKARIEEAKYHYHNPTREKYFERIAELKKELGGE